MQKLLEKFPLIVPFRRERDEEKLFQLMDRSPMQLPGFQLLYDRRPSFEALLKLQAPNFETFVGIVREKLAACFSISYGPRWVNGQEKTVSYLGDFRAMNDRFLAKSWRKFYPEFLQRKSEAGIDLHMTAILADNTMGKNNLVNRRKNLGFRYDFVAELTMVNTFGRRPFSPAPQFLAQYARKEEEAELVAFLDQESRKQLFGYCYQSFEWNFRKKNWPKFSADRFLVIKQEERIVAACLPWSPSAVKRMRMVQLNFALKAFKFLLQSFMIKVPGEGEAVETLYLSNLHICSELSPDVKAKMIHALIHFVMKNYPSHMYSWADQERLHSNKIFSSFFHQNTNVTLYTVHASDAEATKVAGSRVYFEMALV